MKHTGLIKLASVCLFIIAALFFGAGYSWADDATDISLENRLLSAELSLARKQQIYFIVDLKANKIHLKCRGIVLRDSEILGVRLWGSAPRLEPLELTEKTAIFAPKRENITPTQESLGNTASAIDNTPAVGALKKDPYDIKALELSDMPTTYSLRLGDEMYIMVRPKAPGAGMQALSLAQRLGWYGYMPLRTLWLAAKKQPVKTVELTLSPRDAQAFYWSFLEGVSAIVYMPQKQ